MKTLILIMSIIGMVAAQMNYSGYRDTVLVTGFQSTGTGTTRGFEFSQFENVRLFAMANDTSATGFASDSINFQWGISIGDVVINSSGKRDTTWQECVVIDTFNTLTAANMVQRYMVPDTTTGNVPTPRKYVDTVNVTGYAVQDRAITPAWSPVFRYWYTGLTGNKVSSSYIKLIFGQSRRVYSNVHNQ